MKMKVTILKPAGNDTALVEGIPAKTDRKKINDKIMELFPNVEQVGFYDLKNSKLEMAGGEFCGNATRSFAYLALNGKKDQGYFKISGTTSKLKAGVKTPNTSFAQMPIFASFNKVEQISINIWRVEIKGITHLITPLSDWDEDDLKSEGKKLLKKYRLLETSPAAGVMFYSELKKDSYKIDPIVWVRDLKTLFYETACASGTTAFGLMIAKQKNESIKDLKILQPSDQFLSVSISVKDQEFEDAYIEGPIKVLEESEVEI